MGLVYFGTYYDDNDVYALDAATGEVRWRYTTGYGVYSSPTVVEGVVYIGSNDGYLYALHGGSGELHWRYFTAGPVESSPTVVDGVVYVGSGDGHLHALDADNGDLLWQAKTGGILRSTPAVADGVVYVGSLDGHIYALDAASGRTSLALQCCAEGKFLTGRGRGNSLLQLGRWPPVCPGCRQRGSAQRVDLLWRREIGEREISSPTVVDGVVYVGSDYGYMNALDAASGDLLWYYLVGGDSPASPAMVEGVIYIGSNRVYALEVGPPAPLPLYPQSPLLWRYEPDAQAGGHEVFFTRALVDGALYVGDEHGYIHALDPASGERRWSYQTGGGVYASPAVAEGTAYIGSDDGNLYALDCRQRRTALALRDQQRREFAGHPLGHGGEWRGLVRHRGELYLRAGH